MKAVRKVMLQCLLGEEDFQPRISKDMVRAAALISLLPGGQALSGDEVENLVAVKGFALYDFVDFVSSWAFVTVYTLIVFIAGFAAGFYLRKVYYEERVRQVVTWAVQSVREIASGEAQAPSAPEEGEEEDAEMDQEMDKVFDTVEEWDPEQGCLREHRVLDDPEDAESEEEYFKVKTGEAGDEKLVRYYRPNRHVRNATGVKEECAEMMDERYDDRTNDDQDGIPRLRLPQVQPFVNPQDMPEDGMTRMPILQVGLGWTRRLTVMNHLPPRERVRAQRIIDGFVFSESNLDEFLKMRIMDLYPRQPDLAWDYPLYWDAQTLGGYRIFRRILVDGVFDIDWASWLQAWHSCEEYRDEHRANFG